MGEKEIQAAFEKGYERLEAGLIKIASFVGTGVGIIDSLAIDDEGNPVVFEFKREGGSAYEALIQALDYAVWCNENFSWLEKTIHDLGHKKQISRNIRIIIVASAFDERIKNAARGLEFDVQLVSFGIYEDGGNTLILPRIEADTTVSRSAKEPPPPKTKDQHLIGLSENIAKLYAKFEDRIKGFTGVTVNYQPQNYIGLQYKGYNFVGVHPKREWIRLDMLLTSDEARTQGYVGMSGDWGYFQLKESTFDQAVMLAELAHKKISERH